MPDPKFAKPWHGVPREEIRWNPAVDESLCIGCDPKENAACEVAAPKRYLQHLHQVDRLRAYENGNYRCVVNGNGQTVK